MTDILTDRLTDTLGDILRDILGDTLGDILGDTIFRIWHNPFITLFINLSRASPLHQNFISALPRFYKNKTKT